MKSNQQQYQGWTLFLKLCQDPTIQGEMDQVFNLLLTPEEKANLSARCLIIRALLENKMPQRELADTFNVSISQITRGSNALKGISYELVQKLIKILEEPK